jgi:hypothetical protein
MRRCSSHRDLDDRPLPGVRDFPEDRLQEINLSQVFTGQKVGVKQTAGHIWLVSFMDYDLGYFDDRGGTSNRGHGSTRSQYASGDAPRIQGFASNRLLKS